MILCVSSDIWSSCRTQSFLETLLDKYTNIFILFHSINNFMILWTKSYFFRILFAFWFGPLLFFTNCFGLLFGSQFENTCWFGSVFIPGPNCVYYLCGKYQQKKTAKYIKSWKCTKFQDFIFKSIKHRRRAERRSQFSMVEKENQINTIFAECQSYLGEKDSEITHLRT